jgi:hypothetical protein
MCDCGFVVMLLSTFFVMGLMCGGIVLLIQASGLQKDQAFNAPFHSYSESPCTIAAFKAVVDTTVVRFENCDSDGDFCDVVPQYVGIAAVRVPGVLAHFAAVLQRLPLKSQRPGAVSGPSPLTSDRDQAVNVTFGTFFPLEIGDRVVCGVPSGPAALFSDVDAVPHGDVVALSFNLEAAQAAWQPIETGFVAGGSLLGSAFVLGVLLAACVTCYCRHEPKSDYGVARRVAAQQRERDSVEGTLSRNTCEYGVIDWCGYCCFTMFGGRFVEDD